MCVQNNEMLRRDDNNEENDVDLGIFEPIRIEGIDIINDDY